MSIVKLAFDIDMKDLPAVLEAMRPYQKGIAFAVGIAGGTFNQAAFGENQLAMDPDQTPEVGQPFHGDPPDPGGSRLPSGRPNGNASPGKAKSIMAAVAVLREAGRQGMAAGPFHDAMMARGFTRQASYSGVYMAKGRGLIRQAHNKRLYVTREGNRLE